MEKPEAPVSFRQVLTNRQFRALWLAQLVSNFGDWLALLALFSFIAFRLNGTPSQIAGMLISFTLPVAILGPIAGVFVDRWNLKRTMIASDLIRAVLAGLLAVSTELYQIYLITFALSCVSCFFLPAQMVAIPILVRKEELLVANSINAQTVQLIRVISPAIAGALVAWAGHKVCFYIDSLSFVLSAALLSTITLHRETTAAHKGHRIVTARANRRLEVHCETPRHSFLNCLYDGGHTRHGSLRCGDCGLCPRHFIRRLPAVWRDHFNGGCWDNSGGSADRKIRTKMVKTASGDAGNFRNRHQRPHFGRAE
jgi:Transmembrane secretion effector